MNDTQIRQIVQDELRRSQSTGRFGLNSIPYHTHDGVNSQKVKQADIIPSVSVSGNISFAASDTYTIYLNSSFTPSHITAYGNITGSGAELFFSIGSANLTPSFYLQPDTTRTVKTGTIEYPFIDPNLSVIVPLQSSCYIGAESTSTGNNMHSLSSEGHIVNVFYGGDIKARATVTEFSKNFIKFKTSIDSGWEMNINYIIT